MSSERPTASSISRSPDQQAMDKHYHRSSNPLAVAAELGHTDIVRLLLASGVKTDRDPELLFTACTHGHLSVIEELLAKGWNLQQTDRQGHSLLHLAAMHGRLPLVIFFLAKGLKVNMTDGRGYTALYHAAHGGHRTVVRKLLEKRAKVDSHKAPGTTPLCGAVIGGHLHIVNLLLTKNAAINFRNEYISPLHYAVDKDSLGNLEILDRLINQGAKVNMANDYDETPLSRAAMRGFPEVVAKLIEHKANINAQNSNALTQAVSYGNITVVRKLIEAKASVQHSMLGKAIRRGDSEIEAELRKAGATLMAADSSWSTEERREYIEEALEKLYSPSWEYALSDEILRYAIEEYAHSAKTAWLPHQQQLKQLKVLIAPRAKNNANATVLEWITRQITALKAGLWAKDKQSAATFVDQHPLAISMNPIDRPTVVYDGCYLLNDRKQLFEISWYSLWDNHCNVALLPGDNDQEIIAFSRRNPHTSDHDIRSLRQTKLGAAEIQALHLPAFPAALGKPLKIAMPKGLPYLMGLLDYQQVISPLLHTLIKIGHDLVKEGTGCKPALIEEFRSKLPTSRPHEQTVISQPIAATVRLATISSQPQPTPTTSVATASPSSAPPLLKPDTKNPEPKKEEFRSKLDTSRPHEQTVISQPIAAAVRLATVSSQPQPTPTTSVAIASSAPPVLKPDTKNQEPKKPEVLPDDTTPSPNVHDSSRQKTERKKPAALPAITAMPQLSAEPQQDDSFDNDLLLTSLLSTTSSTSYSYLEEAKQARPQALAEAAVTQIRSALSPTETSDSLQPSTLWTLLESKTSPSQKQAQLKRLASMPESALLTENPDGQLPAEVAVEQAYRGELDWGSALALQEATQAALEKQSDVLLQEIQTYVATIPESKQPKHGAESATSITPQELGAFIQTHRAKTQALKKQFDHCVQQFAAKKSLAMTTAEQDQQKTLFCELVHQAVSEKFILSVSISQSWAQEITRTSTTVAKGAVTGAAGFVANIFLPVFGGLAVAGASYAVEKTYREHRLKINLKHSLAITSLARLSAIAKHIEQGLLERYQDFLLQQHMPLSPQTMKIFANTLVDRIFSYVETMNCFPGVIEHGQLKWQFKKPLSNEEAVRALLGEKLVDLSEITRPPRDIIAFSDEVAKQMAMNLVLGTTLLANNVLPSGIHSLICCTAADGSYKHLKVAAVCRSPAVTLADDGRRLWGRHKKASIWQTDEHGVMYISAAEAELRALEEQTPFHGNLPLLQLAPLSELERLRAENIRLEQLLAEERAARLAAEKRAGEAAIALAKYSRQALEPSTLEAHQATSAATASSASSPAKAGMFASNPKPALVIGGEGHYKTPAHSTS